jgi:spermidine synthase
MKRGYPTLAIGVGVASLVAMEILGGRMLAPICGQGLILWSILPGVTLASLSAGLALGGRWSDRGASAARLGLLLAAAGLWLLAGSLLRGTVLNALGAADVRVALLLAALAFFSVPSILIGMAGPHALKLGAPGTDGMGRWAGGLAAVAALGGVSGLLLSELVLLPSLGTSRLLIAVGIVLIGTGLPGLVGRGGAGSRLPALVAVLMAGAALGYGRSDTASHAERGVVFLGQSPYAELSVVDDRGFRYLLADGALRAAVDTALWWESLLPHENAATIARRFRRDPGDLLLVGLGGGTVARHFAMYGWSVEAVEIDPLVVDVARRFFGVDAADVHVSRMDGRRYLRTRTGRYDAIIVDAPAQPPTVSHLLTKESLDLMKSRLNPGGLLVISVPSIGWEDEVIRSVAATAKTCFSHVVALPTMEPPNAAGEVVLLARDDALDLVAELPIPQDRFSADYDRAHAWDNRFEPSTSGATILTDERSAYDLWTEWAAVRQRNESRGQGGRTHASR